MFRNKKSEAEEPFVQILANQLGVERRLNVRIDYPERTTANLPAVTSQGRRLRVQNISIGGCCLIDHNDIFGPDVGVELSLDLVFSEKIDRVRVRLVGSVDKRRHFQFLDLSSQRIEQLKNHMLFGVRALSVTPVIKSGEAGPSLQAKEIWSSMQGDALVVEDGVHLRAHAEIAGDLFYFYKGARPQDRHQCPVSDYNLSNLILFLANIQVRSPEVKALQLELEEILLEGQG
jgi:hypothetical protein